MDIKLSDSIKKKYKKKVGAVGYSSEDVENLARYLMRHLVKDKKNKQGKYRFHLTGKQVEMIKLALMEEHERMGMGDIL